MFQRWKPVNTQIRRIWSTCRRWLRSQTFTIPVIVLFVALFGPLVCIIHCHLLPVLPTANITKSSYFCQILAVAVFDEASPSSTPQLPNSIYPLPPSVILSVFISLLLCARGLPTIVYTSSQIILLIPTPPPR
ncbi:MAG: hypothetical protein AAGF95_10870 [Chloroflexota bacterium]